MPFLIEVVAALIVAVTTAGSPAGEAVTLMATTITAHLFLPC